ncbi:MAG: hypothetical protein NVV74_14155 [Magnetospirillum sp.]|nr:hypothetical protein [Magnetospirillum sp.]
MIRPFLLLALSALAACAEAPSRLAAGPALPPAPLPQWRVGDSVSWSNGQTETVVAVDGEVVRWRDQDGNTYSGYRNFALPSLAWDYPTTRAVTEMDVPPGALWPLKPGNAVHFVVNQRLTLKVHNSEHAYHDEWQCMVDGTERVAIRLGSFDTYRLRCQRYWRGSNIGEIVWNYAPELGQVVRRNWTEAKEPEELVAIGSGTLGAKAEKVAAKVRQRGLEVLPAGGKAVGRAGTVETLVQPKATFRTEKGVFCRDFLQTVSTNSARTTTAGSACRGSDGKWVVVDRLKEKED